MQENIEIEVCITGGPNPHNWIEDDPALQVTNWSLMNFLRLLKKSSHQKTRLILLVHPLMEKKYFISVFLAKIAGAKIVFFYESTKFSSRSLNFAVTFVKRIYFSFADFIFTVGVRSSEHSISFGVQPSHIVEFFNAIDPSEILKYAPRNHVKNSINAGHRFLFIGQFIPRKNIEVLLHAFSKIRKPNDSLTLTGSGFLQAQLEEKVTELGLEKWVTFTGYLGQAETYKTYFHHDTLILPSTEEVWGLVANEALTSGMHVVVSELCGVCDLISAFPGVFICGTDTASVSEAMLDSAEAWHGRIENPKILDFGTKNLAESFVRHISSISREPTKA